MRKGWLKMLWTLCIVGWLGQLPVAGKLPKKVGNQLAKAYQLSSSDPQLALDQIDSLLSTSLFQEYPRAFPKAYNSKGAIFFRMGNLEMARSSFLQSLHLARVYDDTTSAISCLVNLGSTYLWEKDYEHALTHFQVAEPICKVVGDSVNLGIVYIQLGTIRRRLQHSEEALAYYHSAIPLVRPSEQLAARYNIATIHLDQENDSLARREFLGLAESYRENGNLRSLSNSLNSLGVLARRAERPREALAYLEEALEIQRSGGFRLEMEGTLLNLANVHHDLGKSAKGLGFLEELLRYKKEEELPEKYYRIRADLMNDLGRHREAFDALKVAGQLSDSLESEERVRLLTEMETAYRSKAQQQEILSLEREQTILLQTRRANELRIQNQFNLLLFLGIALLLLLAVGLLLFFLQKSRFEKRRSDQKQQLLRMQMNPHFIFNALNSIQLFMLQNRAEEGLSFLNRFGKLMRLILNHSEEDLVPLDEELELLKEYLYLEQVRANKAFDFSIEVPEGLSLEVVRVPGMVLQVLVENAIWHGVMKAKERGELTVRVVRGKEKEDLIVEIEDNGPGYQVLEREASETKDGRPHGLQLVQKRLRSLRNLGHKMEFAIERRTPMGTRARILVKKAYHY